MSSGITREPENLTKRSGNGATARRGQKNVAFGGTGAEQGSRDTSRGAPGPKKIIFPTEEKWVCRLQTHPALGLLLQGLDLAEPVPTSGTSPSCSASCPPRGGAGGSQNNPGKARDLFIVLKKAPGCFQKLSERPHLMRKSRLRLVSLPMLKTWLGGSQVLLWGS